jgi:hypothetical protein
MCLGSGLPHGRPGIAKKWGIMVDVWRGESNIEFQDR